MESEGRLIAADGDAARSDELLTCTTTNIRYRMENEKVEGLLLDAIRNVYCPEAVYRRIAWNAAHVYGKQLRGIPPTNTWAQRSYLVRYALGTLARMVWHIGIRSRDRRHFWRFVATLARLRRAGQIPSALETLLRDGPHAHHLIEWGRHALPSHARAPVEKRTSPT